MSGYVKKIAVIKQLKGGFSADGGQISGLVKAETYAGFLKVEVSLINFAPLTEGCYLLGITDGLNYAVFEGLSYEGESDFNLSSGFAFLVCFCHNKVAPVASAACGQMACALPDLKEEMAKREKIKPEKKDGVAYDDEAITEVNYYERNAFDADGGTVREDKKEEEARASVGEDEAAVSSVQGGQKDGENGERKGGVKGEKEQERVVGGLAGGDFYSRMESDIEKIFAAYPRVKDIEDSVEGSRFVKITYAENKYYVFGVLSVEGKPRYVCYGVPAHGKSEPPPTLKGCASYIPTAGGGYFMTYQDAATGVSVKLEAE